jgi:RimJ/RimL family protein N-acetyltransferase
LILSARPITLKNGKKLTLRTLKPFEALPFLQHLQQAHSESYRNLNRGSEYWQSISVADEEKIITDFQNSNSKFMMCAVHDEKIVAGLGFFGCDGELVERTASLGMSIQKAYGNLGLGTAMMQYTLEQAKLYGFHRIELSVRTYNVGGIALYEKMGFKKIGTRTETAFIDGKYVDEFYYEIILK